MDEVGADPFDLAGDIYPHPPLVHLFHQDLELQFSQPRSNAAMDAVAKRKVPPGIVAVQDDLIGIVEHLFIAVGRDVPQDDLVTLLDLVAEQFGIRRRGAAHVGQRGLEPDDFLHRVRDHRRIGLEQRALIGEAVEAVDDPRHGVAGGIVAAHDQQDQVAHEFLRAHVVHRIGMDHHRDQVAGRLFAHPVHPQRLEIARHFLEDFPAGFIELAGKAQFDIAGPVRPEGQQAAIVPRKAEQDRQHSSGQFDRNLVDPVELLAIGQRIERRSGPHPHFVCQMFDLGRGEGRGDRAALAGVFGPVHRNEHRQTALSQLLWRYILGRLGNGDPAVFP